VRAIARYARLVALPHTVFSLPFALGAAAVAGRHSHPSAARYFWIVVAVAAARTAAMAFNRWADRDFDRMNARTAGRALPRGLVSPAGALLLTATASALFLVSAWQLGKLPLLLSPLALAVCLGYSLAKRVTNLSHLVLGVALAGAPMGAWIAITGGLSRGAVALSGAVAAWVAGFDLIYACQDVEFDRGHGLGSIPARWGIAMALRASIALHVAAAAGLVLFGLWSGLGPVYFTGVAAMVIGLTYEHAIVSPDDLSRVDQAFFTLNGWVALLFGLCTVVEVVA